MSQCGKCHADIPEGVTRCPVCNAPVGESYSDNSDDSMPSETGVKQQPLHGEILDEQPASGEALNDQPDSGEIPNGQPASGEAINDQPSSSEILNEQPASGEALNDQPSSGEILNGQPDSGEALNEQPLAAEEDPDETFSPEYKRLSEKYADIKSSAATLLIIGIAGFIIMILQSCDIIRLPFSMRTHWIFYTVLGVIFAACVIAGLVSSSRARRLKPEADAEDALIDEILKWFEENYTKESVDASIETDVQDELLYFNRSDFIKDKIMRRFETADEDLVDSLIEPVYQDLFETAQTDMKPEEL